jgi:hypothetical protein
MVFGCLSLIVVGALARFDEGQSTRAQRGWIISWLVVSIGLGWLADISARAWCRTIICWKAMMRKLERCPGALIWNR